MSDTTNSTLLEVQNLNKHYGEVHAVKNLTFQVKKGEVFGFLGPNAAGKTTTMRIITCFIPASSGTVKVSGLDIENNSLEIRKKIGYLPEQNPLYNDMFVYEYLKLVGEIRGMKGKTLDSRIQEMSNLCGLAHMMRRQIGKLSKGFRQRVGLAQAMIHNPELLILDEPTSGLDPNQIIEIRQLIKNIGSEKTVIYCSHILSEVSATCNKILIINDGALVATGTAEELTSQMDKGTRFHLHVKADRTSIETKLSELNTVASASVGKSDGEWLDVQVVTEGHQDIGEQLFQCAVDNGWRLSELRKETVSLEDVFTKLTRG